MAQRTTDDRARVFAELATLARDGLPGDVSEARHVSGRARLVEAVARERAAKASPVRWALPAVAMAAAVAIGVGAVALRRPADLAFSVEGASTTPGGYVSAPPASEALLRFADGSDVRLTPGSRARVVAGEARHVVLESGHAAVHIAAHASVGWLIDVGPFALRVESASLDVAWSGNDLDVAARDGSAVVKGPLAPNGVTVVAGQHLVARLREGDLHLEPTAASLPPVPAPDTLPAPSRAPSMDADGLPEATPDPSAQPIPGGPTGRRTTWSRRVSAGDYASVVRDAESGGIDASLRERPLADLVALADASRYTNRSDLSRRALLAERSRFPGSKEARTAAFLLGRINDDQDHAPAAAIEWYDRYLREAAGGPFAPEALGRKMIAVSKVSGREAARPVAEQYVRRHPQGSYAAAARELLSP